ncbi:dinitrogenase iron-molybdenum cofactor biosynthesis protein [Sideroxydans lithotrophicus]|uniref:Dinitrogenase iron-molybdenum cofactor biosynthesis protein n=1 Tax=Sideroxydans lithotrophicus (strain ES-1) TaxID=580332 RepID=D5CPW0_SIDLE|nr:dinitrogenase iron-molybdenum cofactor biosynthesis protein [Sideroxydans lithotrophicus]ADE11124.1 Dinitrogenase iron-molybdenum cofactor biosynthesis protein [Sideroxydans lithotrophicus ES-1]
MTTTVITKTAALRIAQAARALADVNAGAFAAKLGDSLGLPITEEKLAKVTVADLKLILSGEETVEPDVDSASIKLAVRHLWGEAGDADNLPPMDAYVDGEIPGSLRVAVASNTEENLDGHFGSCPRFLIYQVGRNDMRLIDARSTLITEDADDKNVARAELISDCQIVYVQSIGGPAAAKAVRANIHPVKVPDGGKARVTLQRLQSVLDAPPPWLAKILGVEAKSLSRFSSAEEE